MKNQAELVSSLYETADHVVKYNVKCMVAAMYEKDWTEILVYWKRLHILFNSEFETKQTRKAFSEIQQEISVGNDLSVEIDTLEKVEETFQKESSKPNSTLYARSKFYIALKQTQTDVKCGKTNAKTAKKNPYYNPVFEEVFLKRLVFFSNFI